MFEFIEKVIFINLDYRTDRRSEIESELFKYFPRDKIIRLSAFLDKRGNIGCTKSHIRVLEMAIEQGWKNYLVVEDDAVWSNFENGYSILESLVKKPFDVIQLGSTYTEYDKETYKTSKAWTTTAYIVNSHYYEKLLSNFKDGLNLLLQSGIGQIFAIDVYMGNLQKTDNWYAIVPSLMIQRAGYSDIEKHVIDNGKYFS
jgi:glycosyl transferase family 25